MVFYFFWTYFINLSLKFLIEKKFKKINNFNEIFFKFYATNTCSEYILNVKIFFMNLC